MKLFPLLTGLLGAVWVSQAIPVTLEGNDKKYEEAKVRRSFEKSEKKIPLFTLPPIDFADLTVMDELAVSSMVNALTTVGALQITGIPHFSESREKALQSVANCLLLDPSAPSLQMGDGKRRISTMALSKKGVAGPMSGSCGQQADALRASVDGAVYQLLKAMDKYSAVYQNNNRAIPEYVIEPYSRYSDIFHNGEHLEHLHAFFSPDMTSALNEDVKPTLDFHTDAGLFIAMTTGLYTTEADDILRDETNGLYLQLLSGAIVEVNTVDDALIVMVGDGGARWMAPLLGASLRAAPHSLRVSSSTKNAFSRAWFGKMFLPPGDALLPGFSSSDLGQKLRYEEYRSIERRIVDKSNQHIDTTILPSACGKDLVLSLTSDDNHLTSSYSHLVGNDLCSADDGTGVMCWTQCYSVAGLPCGLEAECVDTATGEVVDGNEMCPSDHENCELQCVNSDYNSTDYYDDYCWGNGVTMYMSGFKSLVSSHKGKTECINLFFEEWTLDDSTVFSVACIGVFFLGVAIEFLVFSRRVVFNKMESGHLRDFSMVLLHGTNVVLSYFIMLAVMTYNVELFTMAVVGLTVGYVMFNLAEPPRHKTDPCCSLGDDGDISKNPITNSAYIVEGAKSDLQSVLFRVNKSALLCDDKKQIEITKKIILDVKGVRTCEIGIERGFEVCFFGDKTMACHIATLIGRNLGVDVIFEDELDKENACFYLRVDGMTCGSCTETVRRAVAQVEGVKFCEVFLKEGLCGVVMPTSMQNAEAVISAIDVVGFDANRLNPIGGV